MFELPFNANFIIFLSFISLFLGLLFLLSFILNRFLRTAKRLQRKEIKKISLTQTTFRFIILLFWIFISAASLFLAAFIQSYQRFTKKELVAIVRCMPLKEEKNLMQLELTPVRNGQMGEPEGFILNGNQWAIEGDILKWDDWLNFVGLHTMFKLTRVRGRFVHTQDEISHTPRVYSLVEKEEDPKWRWLYKYGHKLPFVNAVYGNTVFTYPSKDNIYEIYVTTSGFIAKIREE